MCLICITMLSACGKQKQGEDQILDHKLTIMAPLHAPYLPDKEIVAAIEEGTNTDLEIEWVLNEIYLEKLNTAIATDSLLDVTYVKQTDYMYTKGAIRSGLFWEIGPYLKDYPNLRHLNQEILMQTAVDSKVYGLYTERPSSRQGVIIRKDWLDALGLPLPGTIEELYEVLKQFTYGDPDGNGKDDTFGLTDRSDLIFGAFKTVGSYFGTPNNWTYDGEQFIPEFATEAYMETMRFMRKLYEEQLINSDFAVASKQLQRSRLINGEAGVYIGSMSDAERLADEAKKINPDAEFTLINRIKGPSGYHVWSIPNHSGLYLFSKESLETEDELRQALAFFDRTMDADISNLMRYGFEGRHHVVKDGKIYMTDEMSELRTVEVNTLYTLMIADRSNPNIMPMGNREPLLALAEKLYVDNELFIVGDPMMYLDSPTEEERGPELHKMITDATYQFMIGSIDEEGFREEVERWRKAGGEQIIQEYNEAYHNWKNPSSL
ncbi:extracellular solute-binding protein [Marinicrinis lubricantis]|uniref:Extracellular solute-binding protein n=1 Tax=Marinicrinis lubricantis TaxID=2086470 RepID=A0ABW1IJK9_9BACL